jgi:hypothetical protein
MMAMSGRAPVYNVHLFELQSRLVFCFLDPTAYMQFFNAPGLDYVLCVVGVGGTQIIVVSAFFDYQADQTAFCLGLKFA